MHSMQANHVPMSLPSSCWPRVCRGQGEEQEEHQQAWWRSVDGADGVGTENWYVERVGGHLPWVQAHHRRGTL